MPQRPLSDREIAQLERQGCRADDWSRITVADGFEPGAVRDTAFSGTIRLGRFEGSLALAGGMDHPAGLYHCRLHNVALGDGCLIRHADVADADIGPESLVNRTVLLAASGQNTSFANGAPANVLTEHGGRSVPLWRSLSTQAAHLLCHLRGHPAGEALRGMVRRDAAVLASRRSAVSAGCRIEGAGKLLDVYLEDGAVVDGAARLENCYVASSRSAPAYVGAGTDAKTTVFQRASRTEAGVKLVNCLVGEGARLERGFSAEHSLFFANSAFAQGEACSVMAGPFSMSHHKATLALTCQCAFCNFGSAANASNHHFKLGPLHGGVLQRGARLGSGSYLFFPAAIGAFSTITGRNSKNLELRHFPYSLIVGEGERSVLVPAVSIFGAGLFRDSRKWRDRDARDGIADPVDLYRVEIFSPFTFQSVDRAVAVLEAARENGEDLRIGGAVIPAGRFEPGLKLYRAATDFFTGRSLMAWLERRHAAPGPDDAAAALALPQGDDGGDAGEWRDWGGLLVSGGRAARFLAELAAGAYRDAATLRDGFARIHADYAAMEWRWLAWRWRREHGEPDLEKARAFLERWRETVRYRRACLLRDAVKEFSLEKKISFGIEQDADADFRQARGDFENHPLVDEIEEETAALVAKADAILRRFEAS